MQKDQNANQEQQKTKISLTLSINRPILNSSQETRATPVKSKKATEKQTEQKSAKKSE